MRIRGKPTDAHLSPRHASRGRYTRRSGGGSAIAAAARSLHLSTRGFAAREARQPAPASSSARPPSCQPLSLALSVTLCQTVTLCLLVPSVS